MPEQQQLTEDDFKYLTDTVRSGKLTPEQKEVAFSLMEQYKAASASPAASQQQPSGADQINAMFGQGQGQFQTSPPAGTPQGGQAAAGIAIGLAEFGFNATEFALKLAKAGDAIDEFAPGAGAKLNVAIDAVDQKRKQAIGQMEDMYVKTFNEMPSDMARTIGQELPLVPLAFMKPFQGGTLARAALSNATQAALATSIAGVQDDGNMLSDAAFGALMGIGATYTLQALPGVKSYIGRKWVQEENRAMAQRAIKLEKEVQRVTGNPDFTFSIAELASDNPYLLSIERGAVREDRIALQKQKENLNTLIRHIETRSKSSTSTQQLITDLSGLMTDVSARANGIARRNYGKAMDVLIDKYGDDVLLDGQKYLDDLQSLAAPDMGINSGEIPKGLRDHIAKVEAAVNPFKMQLIRRNGTEVYQVVDRRTKQALAEAGSMQEADEIAKGLNKKFGGLTTEQSVVIMKSHNQLISGERNIFENADKGSNDYIGRFLKQSFLNSMRGKSGGAVELLGKINKAYEYDMQSIRAIQNSHLGKIFGDPATATATPEATLHRIIGAGDNVLGREGMVQIRTLLQRENPELLGELQKQALKDVMVRGRSPAFSTADLETDIDRLMGALSGRGDKSNVGRVAFGLFSPAEQQEMITAARALSTLRNTYVKSGTNDVAAAGKLSDIGINIVSRSAEFMTRLAVRLGSTSKTISTLMTDPRARASLVELAKRGPDTVKGKLAATYLATWLGQTEAEENRKAIKEREAQAQGGFKQQLGD